MKRVVGWVALVAGVAGFLGLLWWLAPVFGALFTTVTLMFIGFVLLEPSD